MREYLIKYISYDVERVVISVGKNAAEALRNVEKKNTKGKFKLLDMKKL